MGPHYEDKRFHASKDRNKSFANHNSWIAACRVKVIHGLLVLSWLCIATYVCTYPYFCIYFLGKYKFIFLSLFIFKGEENANEDRFREWFSRIQKLRSLCPIVPVLALTTTAGPTQRRELLKFFCFRPGYELVLQSPDRSNIKITVKLKRK